MLLTDIVGSSERAAELGDRRWRELLEAHYALMRREPARWRGDEVATTGDGFLATFDGPARAIRCACAIRDGLRALGLATEPRPVLRMSSVDEDWPAEKKVDAILSTDEPFIAVTQAGRYLRLIPRVTGLAAVLRSVTTPRRRAGQ